MVAQTVGRTPSALSQRDVHRNGHGAPATVADLRNRYAQFAAGESRLGPRGVARAAEPHHAREAAVAALDEMKAGFTARPAGRLLAGDEPAVALDHHANRGTGDAGQIDGDLHRVVGLVDVDGGRALAGQRLGAEGATELEVDAADLISEVTELRHGQRVNAGTHTLNHGISSG